MIYWPAKAPGEALDFEFDFSPELQSGENIASRTIAAIGVTAGADNAADGKVSVMLSGGALGTPGIVTCAITTDSTPARTYFETAVLPIGEEPVTLDMAKAQLRYEEEAIEDSLILELVQSAREHVEAYTGTRLVPAVVNMTFPTFADMDKLTRAPVQSITQVQYLDANGALQTLDPATYEFVNVAGDILRPRIRLAYNQKWPSARVAEDAIRVAAVVGYTAVPKPLIRAILMLVGLWFDNRSPVTVDMRGVPTEIPNTVEALLANFRI